MNSNQNTTLLIASILAFTLFSGSISVGNVYATGGLDDEEEEEAIQELQNEVSGINEALGNIELNLQEGANNIQANCPVSTDEIVEEITEVIENVTQEQGNVTEAPQCPIVEEPKPNQTVLPPQVIAEPEPEQNETETGCEPIPEPAPVENETSELEPIICPVNGELLGYTNTTSGEQLPISAGNQTQEQESNNTGFLPPIEIPTEEEEQPEQTVTPTEETEAPAQECNVTGAPEPAPVAPEIEFDNGCGCYVNNNSTNGGESIPLDEPQNFLGDPEKQQEGLYF